MKLITEVSEELEYMTEDKNGEKSYTIRGIFMQAEQMNKNKRIYPKAILEKEVDRYNTEYVNKNRAFGELGHPDGPTVNLDRVSHMISSLKKESNNFIGEAKILNTPNGKIVKELINVGATLGVSSRGMGSLTPCGGGHMVGNDYYLSTAADIVADPSAPDAFVEGIMEGVEFWFDNSKNKWEFVKIQETMKKMTIKQLEENKLRLMKKYLKTL